MADDVKERTRYQLRQLKGRIRLRGLHAIDKRTGAARELVEWRAGVIAAMGGEENISSMKMAVIEEATRTRAYLNHIDAFLLSLESVIDRRSKKLRPIVEARMRIGEHLMKQMDRLGFERVPKPVPTLAEYLVQDKKDKIEKESSGEDNSPNDE
jgi:hypothetical protein